MSTTSWNNYHNSGDDLHSKLRASTAPVVGYPSHPMSLMPGQALRPTPRPNFHIARSRRMSIAEDIRNAHNIPPPLPPPPPLPLYPVPAESEEFYPRPPPPVPSSTPPPPRPPLPPSLTAAAFRVSVPPPPIPPKPFLAPFSPQDDGRISSLPRSLMPGSQSTQAMEQVTESAEPQVDESEIAMAMALSASVSEEEEIQRQKLALQEEEDIAKALEVSMFETRSPGHYSHSHLDNVFASSSSDQSAPSSHNHRASDDEVVRLRAIPSQTAQTGFPTLADSEPAPSQSVASSDHELSAPALTSKQKSTTAALPIETRESTPPISPKSPGLSPGAVNDSPSILSAKLNMHIKHAVSSPSPSTPSDLAYLLPVKEEGSMTPQVETVPEVHLPHANGNFTTMYPTQSPEPITDALPPTLVPSGSESHIPGRHESPINNTVDRSSPISKFNKAYASPARNTSNLPEYSPQTETPGNLSSSSSSGKSTPILKHLDSASVGESSTASGSGDPTDAALSEPLPPSYTEAPLPVTEEIAKQNSHTADLSLASTRNAIQSSTYTPPLRPSSWTSASSHRLPSITSQVDLRAGSSISHLSRNSSTNSSLDPDSNSSELYSAGSRANSTINVNAFVNKELFNGVSVGFMAPKISSQAVPMAEEMPPIISLPYGKARPLHLQGPSWRHLLKLMASLSGTRMEAALDAIATMKTAPKLRTVIQFVKTHHAAPVWRTVFYFTIDYPSPQPSVRHRSVNELPYSYCLAGIPTLLRDAADSPLSKTYTIPASDSVPYPTLPITFPNLALYMQAALEESRRYLNDSHSDYRKLAKMITMCYPDEDIAPDPSERRGLFKSLMIGRSNKPHKRGGNEDTYELVTPFVPDEWG